MCPINKLINYKFTVCSVLVLALVRSAFDILKTVPFETDCHWVSEDGFCGSGYENSSEIFGNR